MSATVSKSVIRRIAVQNPDALYDEIVALREKCRIYEEALQSIESPLSNSRARKIAGEALDHFRCGTCGAILE